MATRPSPGLADQPPERSAALSASASEAGEAGEQPRAFTLNCTLNCDPGGCCKTLIADSVRSGPAWPTATVAVPACSWPRLARVLRRACCQRWSPDVTTVKPAVLTSDAV